MKRSLIIFCAILCAYVTNAQVSLCPGGGSTFATAVNFNPSWISGCANGTSCTGTPTSFDNRPSCEPVTTMDACAPSPSCTTNSQDGNDLWFKFKATSTTSTINLIRQISFVTAIQAFSGGPTCGSLTEIGCAKAGGPSGAFSLSLSGLTVGQIYYYRIFGSDNTASQRSGTFCFCGTVGVASPTLPVVLTEFLAIAQKNKVILKWNTASESDNQSFEVERSTDGTNFTPVATIAGNGTTQTAHNYEYTDFTAVRGTDYYRLKITNMTGHQEFSDVRMVRLDYGKLLSVFSNPVQDKLIIDASAATQVSIMNLNGQVLHHTQLKRGRNEIRVADLSAGNYIIRSISDNESYKFTILK
jgi:hypothetical protein